MKISSEKWDQTVQQEAAAWVVQMHEDGLTPEERVEFLQWLRRSPTQVEEYLRAEMALAALSDHAKSFLDDAHALVQAAQNDFDNVLPLNAIATQSRGSRELRHFDSRRVFSAIAATFLVAGVALTLFFLNRNAQRFTTGIGEQRHIVLRDGSSIDLNTVSSVTVRLSENERLIKLNTGEAFFSVAKDVHRPFRVMSGGVVVQAVGTQFDVYRQESQTSVGVIEGRVTIDRSNDDTAKNTNEPFELKAGESVTVGASPELPTIRWNAERLVAWRQRRLVFDNQPLSAVAQEFNRYNQQQLVIADPVLASQRVSGVFDADKPQGFVRFITRDGNVQITTDNDRELVLTRVQ